MGNPAIFPLIYGCAARDVVIVQVNPVNHPDVPQSARHILDRITEISFNSSLMLELRAIDLVARLVESGILAGTRYKKLNIHLIEAEKEMAALGASSKLDTDWQFLLDLKEFGRAAAAQWLEKNFAAIGENSSVNIRERFL